MYIFFSEFTNDFVELSVHQQNSTVVCNGKMKCSIVFRLNEFENCDTSSNYLLMSSQSDTDNVILKLDSQSLSPSEYCFIVTATNGSFTVAVNGSFIVSGNMA